MAINLRLPVAHGYDCGNTGGEKVGWLGRTRRSWQRHQAYFHTKVLTKKQYRAMLRLLEIFGRHLSILSNQIAVESSKAEPPAVTRAKQFIARNQDGAICLASVAKAVNTSTFYFCKLFKRATGLTFTDYLSRVRIEKAETLLLDPQSSHQRDRL